MRGSNMRANDLVGALASEDFNFTMVLSLDDRSVQIVNAVTGHFVFDSIRLRLGLSEPDGRDLRLV